MAQKTMTNISKYSKTKSLKKIAESNQKYDKGEEQTFTTIGQGADGDDASSDQKQQPEETPEQRKAREEKEAADRN